MKTTFVLQKSLAQIIKLEEERMHVYPLGRAERAKKRKCLWKESIWACLCEGMEGTGEGLGEGWEWLNAKVNKSLKSSLTWPICFGLFCMCEYAAMCTYHILQSSNWMLHFSINGLWLIVSLCVELIDLFRVSPAFVLSQLGWTPATYDSNGD